jgi:hypothetical protein
VADGIGALKMRVTRMEAAASKAAEGREYTLNIEGREIPWDRDTVTMEELAELGGWDITQGVIEVDKDNNERTLSAGEVVTLKPGQGFGKKHKWKRG